MNSVILNFQKNEATEHLVYKNLAAFVKGENKKVLEAISADEMKHYVIFKAHTGTDVRPDMIKVMWYTVIGRIFGITFAAKFMENGERFAQVNYSEIRKEMKDIDDVIKDETEHENALIAMINEEKLGYMSSMVLGLNDAIVELTGALAGFTFAMQNTKLIGTAGFITGIAAALSMAAAEYLSQKSEKTGRSPLKAAFYTGVVYMSVVILLITPFFIAQNYYHALAFTLAGVMAVIVFFSFFVSVVQNVSFKRTFIEMTVICFGVSLVAFAIGMAARKFLNINL
jgi:VIT1/CCC1 family predicted Fe2+/Mn2+ transporter